MGINALVGLGGQDLTYIVGDDDEGETVSVAITSVNGNANPDPAPFSLVAAANGVANNYALKALINMDYETTPSYDIVMTATDSSSGARTATTTVEIEIVNANDVPVLSNGNCFVSKDASSGTTVCQITAVDGDSSSTPWGTLTYPSISISSCTKHATEGGGTCDASGLFELVGATGVLRTASTLPDILEGAVIVGTVTANDGADPAGADTGVFTITITPTNDLPLVSERASERSRLVQTRIQKLILTILSLNYFHFRSAQYSAERLEACRSPRTLATGPSWPTWLMELTRSTTLMVTPLP